MSFILDALRKSEQERQRSENPGVAALRVQSARGYKTVWVVLVAGLVIVNLLLLAFILLRDTPEPATAAVTQPAVVSLPSTSPPDSATGPGLDTDERAPLTSPPEIQSDPQSRELRNELSGQAKSTAAPKPSTPSATSAEASAADKPASRRKETPSVSTLPTFTELTLAGSISLPPLHLDIHVYSLTPAERFVFINMRKYREGEPLKEGPIIDTITDEGVVLRHQGRSFLLTRP